METEIEKTIEQAIGLVEKKAAEYSPKTELYYLIIKQDEDDDGEETGTLESFCENCYEQALKEYAEKYPDELTGKILDYRYYDCSNSETDDFEICDKCAKIFDKAMLLSEQELDHWEGLTDEQIDLGDPRECYQLQQIFSNSWNYGRQTEKIIMEKGIRVSKLAQRVININKRLLA